MSISNEWYKLRRKPLNSLSFQLNLCFIDVKFKSFLYIRTLYPGALKVCQYSQRNSPGYDGICRIQTQIKTKRQCAIKTYIVGILRSKRLKSNVEVPWTARVIRALIRYLVIIMDGRVDYGWYHCSSSIDFTLVYSTIYGRLIKEWWPFI